MPKPGMPKKKKGRAKPTLTPKQRKLVAAHRVKQAANGYVPLNKLTARQPMQDRNDEALQPYSTERNQFDPNIDPVTRDEAVAYFRSEAGDEADALIAQCEYSAIRSWLLHNWARSPLSNPVNTVWTAVELVGFARRHDAGYSVSNKQFRTDALYDLPENLQREAELLAEEARAAWIAAGCPRLSRSRCRALLDHLRPSAEQPQIQSQG